MTRGRSRIRCPAERGRAGRLGRMHNVDTSGGVVFRLRKERLGMETVAPSLGSQLMWMLILVVAVVMGAGFYRVKHRDGNASAPSSSKKAKKRPTKKGPKKR